MKVSYEALLELGTDGRVSPEARAEARRLDALMAADLGKDRDVLMAPRIKPRDIVGDMARAIAAAVAARQTVHIQDFRRIGIDDSMAQEMFPLALKRARRLDLAVGAAMACPD